VNLPKELFLAFDLLEYMQRQMRGTTTTVGTTMAMTIRIVLLLSAKQEFSAG